MEDGLVVSEKLPKNESLTEATAGEYRFRRVPATEECPAGFVWQEKFVIPICIGCGSLDVFFEKYRCPHCGDWVPVIHAPNTEIGIKSVAAQVQLLTTDRVAREAEKARMWPSGNKEQP